MLSPYIKSHRFLLHLKISILDFPGDPVVRSPAASVRDMGLIPGPGGFLMSWGNWAFAAQLLSPGPRELQ